MQRKMFLKYVEVFPIEDRKTVIAVSSQDEAKEMAEQIAHRLGRMAIPVSAYDYHIHQYAILYTEDSRKLCNAEKEIRDEILAKVIEEGECTRSAIHRELHPDKRCPYRMHNENLHSLYKCNYYILVTTIVRMVYGYFGLSSNLHIFLNDVS